MSWFHDDLRVVTVGEEIDVPAEIDAFARPEELLPIAEAVGFAVVGILEACP